MSTTLNSITHSVIMDMDSTQKPEIKEYINSNNDEEEEEAVSALSTALNSPNHQDIDRAKYVNICIFFCVLTFNK